VYRHPLLDFYMGALLALGGPMALMLPQRLWIEMMLPTFHFAPPQGRADPQGR
jgi:hypothetical protein